MTELAQDWLRPAAERQTLDGHVQEGNTVKAVTMGDVMRQRKLAILLRATMLSFLITCGCSDEQPPPPTGAIGPDLVEVAGEVIFVYDNVAADGGVTIDLKLDDESVERLLFAPFYWGDDSDERWALYSKIQQVEIGHRVRAKGERTDRGIELEDLVILDG